MERIMTAANMLQKSLGRMKEGRRMYVEEKIRINSAARKTPPLRFEERMNLRNLFFEISFFFRVYLLSRINARKEISSEAKKLIYINICSSVLC